MLDYNDNHPWPLVILAGADGSGESSAIWRALYLGISALTEIERQIFAEGKNQLKQNKEAY